MTDPSELGRQLAARRKRTTIVCQVCGTEKEVWQRKSQQPRTCSGKCRQQLYRDEKRARENMSAQE